jgi:hypothetical protein
MSLDAAPIEDRDIGHVDVIETIMRGPLPRAVRIAIGRASTCWQYPDGPGGRRGNYDYNTATDLINALLARIAAEIAVEAAHIRGEDEAAALIPTIKMPTETVEQSQCQSRVRVEGIVQVSQCLLLEGDHEEHQNGDLRWRTGEQGQLLYWWQTQAYEVVRLGDLLRRERIHMDLPHLPQSALPPSVNNPLTPTEAPDDDVQQ